MSGWKISAKSLWLCDSVVEFSSRMANIASKQFCSTLSNKVWPDFNVPCGINFQPQALGLTQAKFTDKLRISGDLLIGVADAII